MKLLKDFIARLTSRKFLMVVGIIVAKFYYPTLPDEALIAVLGYVGIEGARDIVSAATSAKVAAKQIEKDIMLIRENLYVPETTSNVPPVQNKPIVPGGTTGM